MALREKISSYEVSWVYPVEKRGGGDQIYDADDAQGLAGG